MTKQEIERKFLVFDPSWQEVRQIFDLAYVKNISQTYLISPPSISKRVRKTQESINGSRVTSYHFNQKVPISHGTNQELEKVIPEEEYHLYLQDLDPKKIVIEKTRLTFAYLNLVFELDIFKDQLEGLVLLEVELDDIDQEIKFPPFLKIKKEVTGIKDFSNAYLADNTGNFKQHL